MNPPFGSVRSFEKFRPRLTRSVSLRSDRSRSSPEFSCTRSPGSEGDFKDCRFNAVSPYSSYREVSIAGLTNKYIPRANPPGFARATTMVLFVVNPRHQPLDLWVIFELIRNNHPVTLKKDVSISVLLTIVIPFCNQLESISIPLLR